MTRRTAVAVLAFAAACSGSSHPAAQPSPTPSLTGSAAFLAFAHGASFGSKDFSGASDDALLSVGNSTCEGFSSSGLSFGRVVQGLVESDAHPSTAEAEAFVRESVKDLCPDQAGNLP